MRVKIAMPVVHGRLSGHFGGAKFFALVDAGRQSRAIVHTQIFAAPPHEPGSLPRWLREQGVQILIVGDNGIGRRALDYLVHHGVEVLAGRAGTPLELLMAAALEERLLPMGEGCERQHDPPARSQECRLTDFFEQESTQD